MLRLHGAIAWVISLFLKVDRDAKVPQHQIQQESYRELLHTPLKNMVYRAERIFNYFSNLITDVC